jgi:STE24 endopeptidase
VSVTSQALRAPAPEVAAYVAHLLGHYRRADVLTLALILAGWTFIGVLLTAAAFRPLAAALGAGEIAHPSDPAGLPLVAIILAGVTAVACPTLAGVGRAVNVRADQYALALTRDPDALAAVLVRTWDHRALAPGPIAQALLYTHPPLQSRIRGAMIWKAAHPPPATAR